MFFCETCGRPCRPVRLEVGLGGYEMYGSRLRDDGYDYFSHCCEAGVAVEPGGRPLDKYDLEEEMRYGPLL